VLSSRQTRMEPTLASSAPTSLDGESLETLRDSSQDLIIAEPPYVDLGKLWKQLYRSIKATGIVVLFARDALSLLEVLSSCPSEWSMYTICLVFVNDTHENVVVFSKMVFTDYKTTFHVNALEKNVKTFEWLITLFTKMNDYVTVTGSQNGFAHIAVKNLKRIDSLGKAVADEEQEVELDECFDEYSFQLFYKELRGQSLSYSNICSSVVRYLNQYFCLLQGQSLTYVEWSYTRGGVEMFRSPQAKKLLSTEKTGYVFRNPTEMRKRMARAKMYNEAGAKIEVFQMYQAHIDALVYTSYKFDPTRGSLIDQKTLNTFSGLKVQHELRKIRNCSTRDYDLNLVDPILKHVHNLCGGDEDCYDYFLDWLAFPLQTGQKTNVALMVKGRPGCGKGLFFETLMIELIYGPMLSVQLAGGVQMVGSKFNSLWKNKMFVVIDEPNKLNNDQKNILKNLITSTSVVVSEKFCSDKVQEDFTNYVFTCNQIPKEFLDFDDRRFFVVQHNNEHVRDSEYFESLRDTMISKEGYLHFYKFLLCRKIISFVKGQAPPQTKLKASLKEEAVDPIFSYLRFLSEENLEQLPSRLPWNTFYVNALAWIKKENMNTGHYNSRILKAILRDKITDLEVDKPAEFEGKTQRCIMFGTAQQLIEKLQNAQVFYAEVDYTPKENIIMNDVVDYDDIEKVETEKELARLAEELKALEEKETEIRELEALLEQPDMFFDKE